MPIKSSFGCATTVDDQNALRQDRRHHLFHLAVVGLTWPHVVSAQEVRPKDVYVPLPSVGQALALPSVDLLHGGRFEAKSAQGKLTVIYWWASWCPFCAVQSPHIEKLWQEHKAHGLQVLGLSLDRKPDDALAYLARKKYSFPSAMFSPAIAQMLAKPKGLPVVVVRGRDGNALHIESGEMFPEDIERIGTWTKS